MKIFLTYVQNEKINNLHGWQVKTEGVRHGSMQRHDLHCNVPVLHISLPQPRI